MRCTPVANAERARPLVPALTGHAARAAKTPFITGTARSKPPPSAPIHARWRKVRQALNIWQIYPLPRPSQDADRDGETGEVEEIDLENQEAKNAPFWPSQEKFHTVVLQGV